MKKISLTSASNITTGKLDANAAEENGLYPYFTCAPEPLRINEYAFDDDVILLAGNNASGNFHCQRYTGKFNAYQRTYVITAKEGFDIEYIYYNLLINLQNLKKFAQGSQTKFLTMGILNDFTIDEIPLQEQKKQVELLKCLDKKIKNNSQICSHIEDTVTLLFEQWFLQYDFPDKNGRPYRSNGGHMVWNEQVKQYIPEGWDVKKLGYYISESKNGDWGEEEATNTTDIKVNCFRGADFPSITSSYELEAPVRYISCQNEDKLLTDGDLIIEISGGSPTQSTGRIGYVNEAFLSRCANPMDCSNFCKAFSTIDHNYQYWFYQYWLSLYEAGAMFNFEGKTTGIKNLMFDEFIKSVMVPKAPDDIMKAFQEKASIYFTMIQKTFRESAELAKMRDELLPMIISGQAIVM